MIELINYTPDPENTVATAAKCCYSSADLAELRKGIEEKSQTVFIKRLIKTGHHSPIEHACFTFAVEGVSRSLLAQITRHRLASFSVKSQRYVSEYGMNFNYIVPETIEKAPKEFKYIDKDAYQIYEEFMLIVLATYEKLIDLGIPKEDARYILPNATETKFVFTMNARELRHFFNLRCCGKAQWEIRELAWETYRQVYEVAPALFENAGPNCIKGKCIEEKPCKLRKEIYNKYQKITQAHRKAPKS